jgi:hypothetical protein
MVGGAKRWWVAVAGLSLGLAACAYWPGGRAPRAVGPAYTSFDDLLPDGIATILYVPDVPGAKERFRRTELSARLTGQTSRGLWRRVDFLRPWVEVAFRQVSDQVDEIAWGTYRAEGREEWFLVARVNQPARHVLERLHERTLPRVAEDIRPLELESTRYRGRRMYEWVKRGGEATRRLVTYVLVGQVVVMGSDAAFVRRAVERRPAWPARWFARKSSGESGSVRNASLGAAMADFERSDDLYLWSRMETNGSTAGDEAARSRLGQIARRIESVFASNLSAVSAGFQLTPPTITGRWRLEWTRATGEKKASSAAFDFGAIVPASAQTFAAVQGLPFDHPLFAELRALVVRAMTSGPFERLRGSMGILRLIPGIGDLPQIAASLEGRAAYCSFRSGASSGTERCVMIALDDPAVVASGLRAAGLLARRAAEFEDYRGRPILCVGERKVGAESGVVFSVIGGALVVAGRVEVARALVDAIEAGETLDRRSMVAHLQRYRRSGGLLAEFYSSPAPSSAAGDSPPPPKRAAFSILEDRRVIELAAGRSYSLCLQRPRGVEIVTSSATGFHWSSVTVGAAAIMLRSPRVVGLFRLDVEERTKE